MILIWKKTHGGHVYPTDIKKVLCGPDTYTLQENQYGGKWWRSQSGTHRPDDVADRISDLLTEINK